MSNEKERGSLQPVGRRADRPVDEIQQLIEKEQELAKKVDQEKQASPENLDQIVRHLPRLIQRTLAKLDAATVFQTFKLAGKDYIVHDRREKQEQPKLKEKETIAEESKKPLEELLIQKGRMVAAKEKNYENYLADPAGKIPFSEQKIAQERLSQFLNNFEKVLLKRFEEGAEITRRTKEGQFVFLGKTTDQWRDFFSRFVQRTVKKHLGLEQIQEWVFRGLVQRQARATIISDWTLANGQLERFVRFHLPQDSQALMQMLAQLNPGARLSKEELQKFLQGELEYLAIRAGEGDVRFAQAAREGKFLKTAQAEEKVAGDLGIQLGAQLKEKGKLLKGKKGGSSVVSRQSSEEEGGSTEQESQFVPWWQYGLRKKHRGPMRWFVVTTYLVFISLIVVALLALLSNL